MRTREALMDRFVACGERLELMKRYIEFCRLDGDWHGVMDASADIRELEMESEVLRWVLE